MYRKDGIVFMALSDAKWGDPKIARILPSPEGDTWGEYSALKDTPWGKLISESSLEALDRAARGDCSAFMKEGHRSPEGCLKLAPIERVCADRKRCLSFHKTRCLLESSPLQDCYSMEAPTLARVLISAWSEGYFVVREKW
jgi:hypothetical protein